MGNEILEVFILYVAVVSQLNNVIDTSSLSHQSFHRYWVLFIFSGNFFFVVVVMPTIPRRMKVSFVRDKEIFGYVTIQQNTHVSNKYVRVEAHICITKWLVI